MACTCTFEDWSTNGGHTFAGGLISHCGERVSDTTVWHRSSKQMYERERKIGGAVFWWANLVTFLAASTIYMCKNDAVYSVAELWYERKTERESGLLQLWRASSWKKWAAASRPRKRLTAVLCHMVLCRVYTQFNSIWRIFQTWFCTQGQFRWKTFCVKASFWQGHF